MALEEKTFISGFDVQPDGFIAVRKTTETTRDGEVVFRQYWRCVLVPNDSQADNVLNEPYYANMAKQAWTPEIVAAYQASLIADQS